MKTKRCALVILLGVGITSSRAQDTWTRKPNFGGTARLGAAGFSIGSKGYVGTGGRAQFGPFYKDFWEYDPATNVWTQKADFGGTARDSAVGFSIGEKGYVGTGNSGSLEKDFWEYDPATNMWTRKSDFGGVTRWNALGLSIADKGFIGLGGDFVGNFYNDFWEFDPSRNIWTQKSNFEGPPRSGPVGFSIGRRAYVGTGYPGNYKDFWEYDPPTNIWTQIANFGGAGRNAAVGFSIGTKGYVGTGEDTSQGSRPTRDFWEYDPASNIWTRKADFPGTARWLAIGWSIGGKGYIGTGWDGSSSLKDFWEYTPEETSIAIDIKPGTFPNSINPRGKGGIPVAILTTDTFDATTVNETTVRFGPNGTEAAPVQSALEDVDGDGNTDMILHFNTEDTGVACGDTSASLAGETFWGQAIEGSDSIKTVGCN